MCYQGMMVNIKDSMKDMKNINMVKRINIKGVVWDSCPGRQRSIRNGLEKRIMISFLFFVGPRPEITVSRVPVYLLVNLMCCLRDKMSIAETMSSSYKLLRIRCLPGLLRRWRGEEVELSLIDGKKHFYHTFLEIIEIFWGREV